MCLWERKLHKITNGSASFCKQNRQEFKWTKDNTMKGRWKTSKKKQQKKKNIKTNFKFAYVFQTYFSIVNFAKPTNI